MPYKGVSKRSRDYLHRQNAPMPIKIGVNIENLEIGSREIL
jgi:hypothetical protein